MLRQIEWRLQNGPITKCGVLPATTLFFWKKFSGKQKPLKQIFWKTKTFFKKLEYRFLVETTKIENTSFPFKTTLFFWKHIFWKTRKFETNFLENKNFFQKTGVLFFI